MQIPAQNSIFDDIIAVGEAGVVSMSLGRSVSGYKRQRPGGGCVTLAIWLGVIFNFFLIVFSMNGGSVLSPGALLRINVRPADVALRAFEKGDFDTAISEARLALNDNAEDSNALMTLTRALIYRSYTDFIHDDDLQTALKTTEKAMIDRPDDANVLAAYAFALQANGEPVSASEVAESALALAQDHILARTALALAYARVGSFEIALRESESALTLANMPETFEAYRAKAISTADLGNYAAAGDILDVLIDGHKAFIPLHFERALYARQVGDTETAEAAYLRVLTLDPENVKTRLRLCELASRIGEQDRAYPYCVEVTQMQPNLPDGWYQLGRIHFLKGEFSQAQKSLNRCSSLQVMQDVPAEDRIFECWYLQGQAAEIQGDCVALVAIYNQFQIMATDQAVRETWVYPPEGPPICLES